MSSKEESAVLIEHICQIGENNYCDCKDISIEIVEMARKLVSKLGELSFEEAKSSIFRGALICRVCSHRGMLIDYIIGGEVPGYSKSYFYNREWLFAICPKCGHWTAIEDPLEIRPSQEI